MAPRFPNAWVDQVYAASSIVDIVSSYLPLQKKGRRHWGLCPFHNEKTPSFSVNPELNLYYCFGCKASGNIAQFVMEMEKLTYPEALLHLAKRFNLPPPPVIEDSPEEEARRNLRERLYDANTEAALFYHEQLWQPENAEMLAYLHQRGLDDATIRRFGLGASPDDWDRLLNHLTSKGFTLDELQQAALVTVKENSRYDTFRNRVMFPIINRYGQTIGFGARAMGNAQPKYLNTSDTLVFNKRYNIYGINLLRKVRNLEQLILVEGYLDVITLSQAGVPNAVATLGTALTAEQARMMKHYAPEVWVAYDGDEPGQAATLRALDILQQEGIPARVLRFPDGLDPDDFIRQRGEKAFAALNPMRAMAFRLTRLESMHDMADDEGKREFARQACLTLQPLREPVEVDYYLGRIALKTGISKEVLAEQMRRSQKGQGSILSGPVPDRRTADKAEPLDQSEFTLAALLATGKLPRQMVAAEDFADSRLKAIVQSLLGGKQPSAIMDEAMDEQTRRLAGELFNSLPDPDPEAAMTAAEDCLRMIRSNKLRARIKSLSDELKVQEPDQKQITLQLISELSGELNRITRH